MIPFYREFTPAPALAHLIECFWVSRAPVPDDDAITHRVLPDGCTDIIFDFGPGPARGDSPGHGLRSYVVGTMRQPLVVLSHRSLDMLGVRFRPGGAKPFLCSPASELTDRHVALDEFWRADAADAESRLFEADLHRGSATTSWRTRPGSAADPGGTERVEPLPASSRIAALQDLLLDRLAAAPAPDARVLHVARMIERTGGRVDVATLHGAVGLGRRQLERLYADAVGIPPKTACRITRLHALLRRLRAPSPRRGTGPALPQPHLSWSRLAHACGYADQPHLVREFRALTGLTPTAYIAERRDVAFVQDDGASAA